MKKTILAIVPLLFIVYAASLVSSTQPVEVKQARMVLRTDKTVYSLGENVTIILENIGDEAVQIGGYPPWIICKCPENKSVYPAIFAYLAWRLDPDQSNITDWNQYNEYTQDSVEPGLYVVRDTQGWGLSATFVIINLPKESHPSGGGCGGSPNYLV